MRYRTLGRTGMKVSEVGFGAWAIGGDKYGNSYGPTDDNKSIAAVQRALDLGCNFFDTADVYGHGHSEELLGQVLKDRRDDVIIATKVGGDFYHGPPRMNFNPGYIEFALNKSCERLQRNYVDLYQLHNPPAQLLKNENLFRTLEKLKEKGRILHYGISIHDPQEGLQAIKTGNPEAIQVVFNILRQEPKNRLFEAAKENGVGIIAIEPLMNGFLTGKYNADNTFSAGDIRHHFPRGYILNLVLAAEQLKLLESRSRSLTQAALRFVLDHNEVSTVIPGVKSREQAEENFSASELPSLTGEELMRIRILREQNFARS